MAAYSNYITDFTGIPNFASAMTRALSPYQDKALRVPFYITNDYRLKRGLKGLSMLMNPNSVQFTQAKRITRKDTQEGAVFMHWTNHLGRNNDILQMTFQGMTGNLNIRRGGMFNTGFVGGNGAAWAANKFSSWLDQKISDSTSAPESGLSVQPAGLAQDTAGAVKVAAFWNLYSLTREPVVDPNDGQPLFAYISYSSPLFGPTFVTFAGHFGNVLDFVDTADEPFNKRWSFSFTAIGSNPKQDDLFAAVVSGLSANLYNAVE